MLKLLGLAGMGSLDGRCLIRSGSDVRTMIVPPASGN